MSVLLAILAVPLAVVFGWALARTSHYTHLAKGFRYLEMLLRRGETPDVADVIVAFGSDHRRRRQAGLDKGRRA